MNILRQAVLALSLTLVTSFASADMITGTISFHGDQTVTEGALLGSIVFDQSTTSEHARTGDFATELDGDISGILFPNDLVYNVSTGAVTNTDIDPLWSVSDFDSTATFKLTSGTVFDPLNLLVIAGEGILSLTGFDPTAGTFLYTSQLDLLTFSAQTSAVPIPAAAWLFGSALLSFVAIGRRKVA